MRLGQISKIIVLVIALVAVLYGMKALKSSEAQQKASDPQSMISLLVGGDLRPLNWCPQAVDKIEILGATGGVLKTLNSPSDISAVCELMIGGYTQEPGSPPVFGPALKAYPQDSGNPVSLERQAGTAVFRVKGMTFSCPALVKILDRLATP